MPECGFAQDTESVESPLATDQHEAGVAVVTRVLDHGDGAFEADGADVVDDLLKDLHVSVAGVEGFDKIEGELSEEP